MQVKQEAKHESGLAVISIGRFPMVSTLVSQPGRCAANFRKWRMSSPVRGDNDVQTHTLWSFASQDLSNFGCDLIRLYSTDDNAFTWLQNVAMKAIAKS